MSDIKLFSLHNGIAAELAGKFAVLEKNLQALIEANMESVLGVRFLKTEHTTGKTHSGRIDSLGLDENGCPVIIEYKRHSNENVINQGLFYLDWLMDHQAEFQLLVQEKLGTEAAKNIEWRGTRLICIAADFNKYDEHAVQQINRNIELMRYRYFGESLLLLELVNAKTANLSEAVKAAALITDSSDDTSQPKQSKDKPHAQRLAEAPQELQALYELLCDYIESLGDEVQRKDLKLYTAFKRIKNFASVVIAPKTDPRLQVYLKIPGNLAANDSFSRDVSNIGHWGTGDFELNIRTSEDITKAQPLIEQSYLNN